VTSAATAPLVIAHRGASGYRPEHSRVAYELAIELGADAIEPDIVATSDGVLVLRHENEISGTTDVAFISKFADRRTTKVIDGEELTGWFTEDFTWEELSTLRTAERLPKIRRGSATFIGGGGILRLSDLLSILDAAGRPVTLVAEIKHPTYFASIGLPLDELFAAEIAGWATPDNLIVECFEKPVLLQIRERGIPGKLVFLIDKTGSAEGDDTTYAEHLTDAGLAAPASSPCRRSDFATLMPSTSVESAAIGVTDAGLAALSTDVDGISVAKSLLLQGDDAGAAIGVTDLVSRAHAAGLTVFVWTLRAENAFLPVNMRVGDKKGAYGDWKSEFALILSSGVDGIFADQPDLAIFARAEHATSTAVSTAAAPTVSPAP
jgi:glycerophosphoryl diester phosphodiesterase